MAIGRESLVKSAHETTTKEEQLLNAPYGQQGAKIICRETQNVPGEFYCVMALRDDVVLSTETIVNWDVVNNNAGGVGPWTDAPSAYDIPLPVGMPFYGTFTMIDLADMSGIAAHCPECPKLIAYYR
tara:strand:- start:126 stop:506 length:381 start_codon:yes stop_codon:yes gene_type:complete